MATIRAGAAELVTPDIGATGLVGKLRKMNTQAQCKAPGGIPDRMVSHYKPARNKGKAAMFLAQPSPQAISPIAIVVG